MPRPGSVAEVVDEVARSIVATPKRQRRLRSKTFWDLFGFKVRTRERVEQVRAALRERGIVTNLDDGRFGAEDKDEWLILSHLAPEPPAVLEPEPPATPTPSDAWFQTIAGRSFESEREVEYYFIAPLLEQLGYVEADIAIGYPVQMYEGVKKVNKEADFVLFNGQSRAKDDALLVVEAKRTRRLLTDDAVGQARGYAMWLTTPYYLVTNGEELRVYLFRGAVQSDVLMVTCQRSELRQHWPDIYAKLHKDAVIEYKRRVGQALAAAQ